MVSSGSQFTFRSVLSVMVQSPLLARSGKNGPPEREGLLILCSLSFLLFFVLSVRAIAALGRSASLFLAWSSPLFLIPLRFLLTRRARLFLPGLLLSRSILLLLLPTGLLALTTFVCHLENS